MTRLTRIVFTALVCLLAQQQAGRAALPQKVWIHLTDRGAWERLSPAQIDSAALADGLTERALERRRIEGLTSDALITIADLPPDPSYLQTLSEQGAEIGEVSRWFNCVSAYCNDNDLPVIRSLPFVAAVEPVHATQPAGFSYTVEGHWESFPSPGPGATGAGLYGPSYLQNLMVNAVEAHRRGYNGRGVLLAVLDSGYELTHESFSDLDIVAEYDFVEDDDNTGYEEGEDVRGQPAHGTGCMSVIAGYQPGNLIGVAHGVSLVLAKTEDVRSETPAEEDNWVAAVEWAERLGASVLSSSLSYSDWYTLADYDGRTPITSLVAERAHKLGMVLATSAGNEGPQPRTVSPPSTGPFVLGIGAVDSTGKIGGFSSRGPTSDGRIKPDLVAMGVRTAVASPFSDHRYSRWNGTSLSTPVMGGVIACVRSARPDWNAGQATRALRATASRADRPDNIYGWGIPDIIAATRWPEGIVKVNDSHGKPLEGARVRLLQSPAPRAHFSSRHAIDDAENSKTPLSVQLQERLGPTYPPITAVTDPYGEARFPNLPNGKWTVQVVVTTPSGDMAFKADDTIVAPDGEVVIVEVEIPQ
ncbi:S8 family serine peptidase [bacterium]|nr:S8 family serine peptidase [bacterium]